MSFWSVMNWVAWGLCAFLAGVIALDLYRVERANRAGDHGPGPGERRD